jgi:hypothetical protein
LATTSGRLLVDGFEVGDTACWSAQLGGTAPTAACPADPAVSPTYASEGRLLAKPAETSAQDLVFYFAGRPVAQLRTGAVPTWTYLTTDHLGTPVAGTNGAQASIWHGGFEPFGAEFTTPSASSAGVFLRLPGQWDDTYWSDATLGASLFYNVRRWYEPLTGRYVRADPLGASRYLTLGPSRDFGLGVSEVPSIESSMLVIARPLQAYGYAEGRPTELIDSLGLSPGTAIAQAGGACILADGPLPIGDVLGVPLVLIGGALMAADWWEDRATCDDCDRADLEARCAAHYDADIQECQRRHPIHDVRSRMACYGHAMVRFDLCMRKMPIPPLQP